MASSPFESSSTASATPKAPWLQRLWHKLGHRWHWRASRSRYHRVTVVSQFFPPDYAATGQLLDDLTSRLAARGLQLQVLTGQPAYAYSQDNAPALSFEPNRCIRRTSVTRLWPQQIRGRAVNGVLFCLRISLRLLRFARRGDLLLYTTEPPYLPVVGWLLFKLTGTPYLVMVYDLYPDVLEELGVLPASHWLMRLWRRLNRCMYADAQELIVLSDPMAGRLLSHCPSVADKIHVIPSWADPEEIRPLAKHSNWFALRHGLEHTFTVLYSGNQGRCHDLVTLLGAALLLKEEPHYQFLFIGKGPQHQRVKQLVYDWDLRNCRFLPYQDLDVLPYSLAVADLAVVSLGIDAEGLVAPSKLYGHLAAGTPIAAITPAGSELQRLVQTTGCGRWFANGDAQPLAEWIRELRADPIKAGACGAAARNLLLRCASPDRITDRYWKLLNRHLPAEKLLNPVTHPLDAQRLNGTVTSLN